MTIAEKIAEAFGNDGMSFFGGPDELHIDLVCRQYGASVETNSLRGTASHLFADGSAIVVAESGWDVKNPLCACGHCWAGERPACEE